MDQYYKKIISWNVSRRELQFRVSQSLFSSQDIDLGTRHLLKIIVDAKLHCKKILDLGCGYGPIGIALKSVYPASEVQMVDKDALALSYSRQNLELNNLSGVNVYASLGYDGIKENDFDLIVSNIPAKVGDRVLTHMLKDSRFHLRPGGQMAIVVIDAIGDYVTSELNDPNIRITFAKRWPGYLVFLYEFLSPSSSLVKTSTESFKGGIYDRNKQLVSRYGVSFSIKTTYNLPEFDTISYETDILLNSLKILKDKTLNSVLIFNSGQGYIPVAISKITKTKKMYLVDRDIQALELSKENLLSNGYMADKISLAHQVGISVGDRAIIDCVLGVLDEDDNPLVQSMLLHEAAGQISSGGLVIFAAGSTVITRLENVLHKEKFLQIVDRKRAKGKSVLVMKPNA